MKTQNEDAVGALQRAAAIALDLTENGMSVMESTRYVAGELGIRPELLLSAVTEEEYRRGVAGLGRRDKWEERFLATRRMMDALELGPLFAAGAIHVDGQTFDQFKFRAPLSLHLRHAFNSSVLGRNHDLVIDAVDRVARSTVGNQLKAIIEVSRDLDLGPANDLRHWFRAAEFIVALYSTMNESEFEEYKLDLTFHYLEIGDFLEGRTKKVESAPSLY